MTTKERTLPAIRPNIGNEARYRRKLSDLIEEMHQSVLYWVRAAYRKQSPRVAQDASPVNELRKALEELARRWNKRFDKGAEELAAYFAQSVANRTDRQLKAILKRMGITVRLQHTLAQKNVLQATIAANVSLIRSIPRQYLGQVQGDVMRAVQSGHDLSTLSKTLQKNYGVSKRRAHLIARDQNNKLVASLNKVRQLELGITQAIWVHSMAGKEPRPTHVAAGRRKQKFDVAKGWYDPHEKKYIQPGELINCRCVARSVLPGL